MASLDEAKKIYNRQRRREWHKAWRTKRRETHQDILFWVPKSQVDLVRDLVAVVVKHHEEG